MMERAKPLLTLVVNIDGRVNTYESADAVNMLLWVVRTWMRATAGKKTNLTWTHGTELTITMKSQDAEKSVITKCNYDIVAERNGGLTASLQGVGDCGCLHKTRAARAGAA